jgi:hypothetical protein
MAIDELNKIDSVMTDKEHAAVYLLLSDHLDWDEERKHLELLQQKLNVYLDFIDSGGLVRNRPDLKGLPVTIMVVGLYPLSPNAIEYYSLAGPMAAEFGVSLEFRCDGIEEVTRF